MFELLPANAFLRADAYVIRAAVWSALCDFMIRPETGVIVAGQAAIARRATVHAGRPVSRSTAGRHLRALEAAGAIFVAQRGASRFALRSVRHRAPSYVICAPVDRLSPADRRALAALKAQLAAGVQESEHLPEGTGRNLEKENGLSHRTRRFVRYERSDRTADRVPRTLGQRRTATFHLAGSQGWGSSGYLIESLQVVFSPFWAAGWTPAAVLHAIEHLPDGSQDPRVLPELYWRDKPHGGTRIRNLPAVLTARLRRWREADGTPMAAPVAAAIWRPGRRRAPAFTPPTSPAVNGGIRSAHAGEGGAANPWLNGEYALARARLDQAVATRRAGADPARAGAHLRAATTTARSRP